MDCYILNSNYEAAILVEGWENFIWTERYSKPSDFTITMPDSAQNRSRLKEGVILMISDSDQPQIIETVQLKKQNGKAQWIVKGRDLTTWMELRSSPWDTTYTDMRVSDIATALITKSIINPGDPADKIPDVSLSNNATDGVKFDFETGDDGLLADVQKTLDDNKCAIRADRILSGGSYSFRYRIYNGTSKNVVFSDRDDTLINTQYIRSTKKFRNRAEVRYKASNAENAKTLTRIVYGNGGNVNKTGLARRTFRVNATNINPADYPGSRLNTILDRMARAALGNARTINAIDGEVPSYTKAKYGKDYYLGDIVKFKADDNTTSDARVTEYVWIIDESGERQYPTVEAVDSVDV